MSRKYDDPYERERRAYHERLRFELGNIIRDKRREKGMTQERLAEEVGLSLNSVSRYETGRTNLSCVEFFNIAAALNITPNDLTPKRVLSVKRHTGDKRLDVLCALWEQLDEEHKELAYYPIQELLRRLGSNSCLS